MYLINGLEHKLNEVPIIQTIYTINYWNLLNPSFVHLFA